MRAFLFVLPFVLFACGKSSDNVAASPAMAVIAQPDGSTQTITSTSNTYAMTTGVFGWAPQYFANYQFKENGCDTDLHKFSGPGPEVVMAQMCSYLQNEQNNHNCARGLRYSYFLQVCAH